MYIRICNPGKEWYIKYNNGQDFTVWLRSNGVWVVFPKPDATTRLKVIEDIKQWQHQQRTSLG